MEKELEAEREAEIRRVQTSESLVLSILLALAGGFMDAYSYLCRGQVFANAETGNVVLLAINLVELNWMKVLRYLVPIVAFALGVVMTEYLRGKKERTQKHIHWRQIVLLLEICVLVLVAFLPQTMNLIVNSLISFTCGTQVSTFSKFHGIPMATTMCTGNLRNGTQDFCRYLDGHEPWTLHMTKMRYGGILVFILGAMMGGFTASSLGEKSILLAALILLTALLFMFSESRAR